MILQVYVVNKIATFQKRGGCIVCGNSDYQIRFTFDSEWSAYPQKTARFIWNGDFHDVTFTGDLCDVPVLYDTTEVEIGVYAGDLKTVANESEIDLKTTTSAFIGCYRSILCKVAKPSEDSDHLYASEAKDAAERAEAAAVKAEEAADRAELEGGINEEYESRLKTLEKWMNDETYVEMTASLKFHNNGSNYRSVEYGTTVTGVELTFSTSKETSSIKLTLPDDTEVDLSKVASPYTDTNTYLITSDKTWLLDATRKDGNNEDKSAEANISYQYRVYWGVGTEASGFDSDFVNSLRKQGTALTNSRSRTLSFNSIDNKYVYYVIPTVLGTPTFQIGEFPVTGGFENAVTIDVDTGFKYIDERVEDDPATEEDERVKPVMLTYHLYRSSNPLTNDEPFKVYIT